jgi:hypothetical protein
MVTSAPAFTATPGPNGPPVAALVPLYAPYCGGIEPRLEQALEVLRQGQWAGERQLQGGRSHPFVLRWQGGLAPLEQLQCELSFPQQAEILYSFAVVAHRLLAWLADAAGTDLPESFWRWLILGEEQPT